MLSGGGDALIEIDVRERAFELSKREMSMLDAEEKRRIEERAK